MSHHAPAVRAQDPTLANRYGTNHTRPGRRRLWAGLGGLGLVVAVLLSVWIGLNMSVGAIEYKDVGFTIEDDGHATVTFQASVPEGVQAVTVGNGPLFSHLDDAQEDLEWEA